MTEIVNIYEAKMQLSRLVDRAAAGEDVVIARAGKPVARLVAVAAGGGAVEPAPGAELGNVGTIIRLILPRLRGWHV